MSPRQTEEFPVALAKDNGAIVQNISVQDNLRRRFFGVINKVAGRLL
jgi:hypothetical protein